MVTIRKQAPEPIGPATRARRSKTVRRQAVRATKASTGRDVDKLIARYARALRDMD
jgi:hypothetical protein